MKMCQGVKQQVTRSEVSLIRSIKIGMEAEKNWFSLQRKWQMLVADLDRK